jgi:Na+-translocating ferredoxin:NAD+ oxidoreductase RnfG subunit
VWQAFDRETPIGWFIVDEVFGKHEYITYATAISNDGKVIGIEITDYRETKGDEVREKSWREQFIGKTTAAPLKLEQDIRNISGATLSCLHIAEGVKRLLALHALILRT